MNIAMVIQTHAVEEPDKKALVCDDTTLSWREFDELTNSFASSLARLGVRSGDRVALYLPNGLPFMVSYWGILKLGSVVCPINSQYRIEELRAVLKNAAPKVLVAAITEAIDEVWLEVPGLQHLIVVGDSVPGFESFVDLIQGDGTGMVVPREARDLCAIHYTSGTTGRSKGIAVTHGNWAIGVFDWYRNTWHVTADDVNLICLPLYHTFGLMMSLLTLASGGTTIVMSHWNPREALAWIEKYWVTLFSGVPTMYIALAAELATTRHDLASLRLAVVGGAPLPLPVYQRLEEHGVAIADWYGCTGWAATSTPLWERTRKHGTLGKKLPYPALDLHCVDEAGLEVPRGTIGEIVVKGPNVPSGYWRQPYRTSLDFRDGWFHTGDLGTQDADGFFFLVDRKDDLIITSGYNVYPREVEEVLYHIPQIYEVAVVGVPHPVKGQVVKAFIVFHANQKVSVEELVAFCTQRLARFKVPVEWEIVSALPKLANGKILRRVLRGTAHRKGNTQ